MDGSWGSRGRRELGRGFGYGGRRDCGGANDVRPGGEPVAVRAVQPEGPHARPSSSPPPGSAGGGGCGEIELYRLTGGLFSSEVVGSRRDSEIKGGGAGAGKGRKQAGSFKQPGADRGRPRARCVESEGGEAGLCGEVSLAQARREQADCCAESGAVSAVRWGLRRERCREPAVASFKTGPRAHLHNCSNQKGMSESSTSP